MANWGIDINADKTEFWLIARPDKKSHNMTRRDVEIRVEEGKSIRPSNQLKYLLVTFQPHGQFTKGERIGGGVASSPVGQVTKSSSKVKLLRKGDHNFHI